MKILITLLFLSVSSLYGVINQSEIDLIEGMLIEHNLSLESLNFPKDWGNPSFRIPVVMEVLDRPMHFPVFIEELRDKIMEKEVLDFFSYSAELIFSAHNAENNALVNIEIPFDVFKQTIKTKLNNISEPIHIIEYAKFVFDVSNNLFSPSFAELSEEDIIDLKVLVYFLARGGSESNDRYDYFFENNNLSSEFKEIEHYIYLINKVNFKALNTAAEFFFTCMHLLSQRDLSHLNFTAKLTVETPHGLMAIGSSGNDVYYGDYVFIYEPGGDDIYTFDISTNINRPFIAIIDKSGDDVYRNANIGELFNAMFGVIYHFDGGGNDFYFGDDLAFSANFGALISIDEGGHDTYIAGSKSLGAGTFGIALLLNRDGNNYFSGTAFTQGFGGTLGLGLLASYAGEGTNNDVFFSGGRYRHAPLTPNEYRSMSQGFGFGLRPDLAGGIGILFDEDGNDRYIGGVFAQGGAYWYALGILIDLEGNDVYNAIYYPQGSGIHLAGGFLYDAAGDDTFYSPFGPGQGAAHDYGVGFLVNRGGNSHFSVAGGNGLALTNSVAVFVNTGNTARFEFKNEDQYGYSNVARQSGGIGIFLNISEEAIFATETLEHNSSWSRGMIGLGKSISPEPVEVAVEEEVVSAVTIDPDIDISELFTLAAQWEVGSAIESVRVARTLMGERDVEAADYIINNRLNTRSGLDLRAVTWLLENSEYMRERLSEGLDHEIPRGVSNTIFLIGETRDVTYLDTFAEMLSEERFINPILSALGRLETEQSIDLLKQFIKTDNVYRRVIVARSLRTLNTPRSLELLLTMKDDGCFLIWSMIELFREVCI
jgi:hypothetical protein